MEIRHGFIKTQYVPEIKIHYAEVNARPDLPLLLFLHGFPDSWKTWKDYLPALASEGFHCVAIDLRGFNKSSGPKGIENYKTKLLVEDLRRVVQYFGKNKNFVVGHDWGGILTWEFASFHPELCTKVIVINAPILHASQSKRKLQKKISFKHIFRTTYMTAFQVPFLSDALLKGMLLLNKRSKDYSKVEKGLNYYRANINKKINKPPSIKVPAILLWAAKDEFLEIELIDGLEDYFEGFFEKRIFPDAGHWLHHEKKDEVKKIIKDFFI